MESHGCEHQKIRVLIAVPSKKIPGSVDRNRIKRKLREIYRLNKSIIKQGISPDIHLILGIIYTGDDKKPEYKILESAFLKCTGKLLEILKIS